MNKKAYSELLNEKETEVSLLIETGRISNIYNQLCDLDYKTRDRILTYICDWHERNTDSEVKKES